MSGPGGVGPGRRTPPTGRVQGHALETGARGVLVADVTDAVTHPCHSKKEYANRGPLADAPEAFLEDMRRYGGLVLDGPSASTFDGRPALEASFKEAICDNVDIHLQGFRTPSEHIRLDVPFRIIVTEVAGSTIMIEAWAGSPEALEEWLPIRRRVHRLDPLHRTARR